MNGFIQCVNGHRVYRPTRLGTACATCMLPLNYIGIDNLAVPPLHSSPSGEGAPLQGGQAPAGEARGGPPATPCQALPEAVSLPDLLRGLADKWDADAEEGWPGEASDAAETCSVALRTVLDAFLNANGEVPKPIDFLPGVRGRLEACAFAANRLPLYVEKASPGFDMLQARLRKDLVELAKAFGSKVIWDAEPPTKEHEFGVNTSKPASSEPAAVSQAAPEETK
ncbi:MAG: hypothetical protein ACYC6M_02985 [Terriglobales bacterium]